MKEAIIVDVDGTLADNSHRDPFDYDKCGDDALIKPVDTLVKHLQDSFECYVIVMSGRENKKDEYGYYDGVWNITKDWVEDNCSFNIKCNNHPTFELPDTLLYMRGEGDNRPDWEVKLDLYNKYVKDKYEVLYVIDDRNQVVDMWRGILNLTCLQVANGDF